MIKKLHQAICKKAKANKKQLAILIDPDKINEVDLRKLVELANVANVDYLFVGGSLMTSTWLDKLLIFIKNQSNIPTILFPGSMNQISKYADGILYLSLISGRNPQYLIGEHVVSAPMIKQSGLEVLPTGYILIDGGKATTVSYMSHTNPIPNNKPEIAQCTAMAGEMLGLKLIYLDAGSGAEISVSTEMIASVKASIEIPLIVGGGIRTPEKAHEMYRAGADLLVVGNVLEKDPMLLQEFALASQMR